MRDQDLPNSRRRAFDADTYHPQPRAFGIRPRFSETRFESTSDPPVRAVVKWFIPKSRFGLVKLSDGSGDGSLHGTVAGSMLTSTDGTFMKPEFLGISVPACEGTKYQTDTTSPAYSSVFMHKTG